QVAVISAAFLDGQGAEDEIGEIADWPALADQLPVEPDPLAIGTNIAVALMTIAVDEAPWPLFLRLGEIDQRIEDGMEPRQIALEPVGQEGLLCRPGMVLPGKAVHHVQLVGIDRGHHRYWQPVSGVQHRTIPEGAMDTGETLHGAGRFL